MFPSRTLLFAIAALSTTLLAEDFGPAVQAAKQAFPGRTHFGVVCNYSQSNPTVADLIRALPDEAVLTVFDARNPTQVNIAAAMLVLRDVKVVALLPQDPLVREGSPLATHLLNLVRAYNDTIPAFGTSPAAVKNGCVFALGAKTNWKLLVNPNDPRKGVIEDITITREPVARISSGTRPNSVKVQVVAMGR